MFFIIVHNLFTLFVSKIHKTKSFVCLLCQNVAFVFVKNKHENIIMLIFYNFFRKINIDIQQFCGIILGRD